LSEDQERLHILIVEGEQDAGAHLFGWLRVSKVDRRAPLCPSRGTICAPRRRATFRQTS
jgi:hypothetical protein